MVAIRRRVALLAVLLSLALPLSAPAAAGAAVPEHLGSIGPGGRLDSDAVVANGSGVWEYTFDLVRKVNAIRVSADLSQRDTCVTVNLFTPNGAAVEPGLTDFPTICGIGQTFNVELSIDRPALGRWRIEVVTTDVDDLAFRLRVLSEGKAKQPKVLLPNLVPWTPFDLGFVAPGSDHPGTANDTQNLPGDPTVSCHPDEEPGAAACLRFSAGVFNVGDGPMYIRFVGDDAIQLAFTRDSTPEQYFDNEAHGRFVATPAGHGEWHEFHDHRHLGDFVEYELLEVVDGGTGQLATVGTGDKHGYCTFSQQIRDWGLANQDHQYPSFTGAGQFCLDYMTLERGWGDVYRWQRPGQYVSFTSIAEPDGTMPAGLYVIRVTVDPLDNIVETNESDNVGYALVRVIDGGGPGLDTVLACEEGLGRSPWDPSRVVLADRFEWAKRALDPGYEPPGCD